MSLEDLTIEGIRRSKKKRGKNVFQSFSLEGFRTWLTHFRTKRTPEEAWIQGVGRE